MRHAANYIGLDTIGHFCGRRGSILLWVSIFMLVSQAASAQIPGIEWKLVYDLSGVEVFFSPKSIHEEAGLRVVNIKAFNKNSMNVETAPVQYAATDCRQGLVVSKTPFGNDQPQLESVSDPKESLIIRTICASY